MDLPLISRKLRIMSRTDRSTAMDLSLSACTAAALKRLETAEVGGSHKMPVTEVDQILRSPSKSRFLILWPLYVDMLKRDVGSRGKVNFWFHVNESAC